MSRCAIHAQNIGKRYRLGLTQADSLAELCSRWMRMRRRGDVTPSSSRERKKFWALRDVNFEVREGEVFGIVGRNGAGKSTLLKLISRITSPTTGSLDLWGRVASLLEVGTGFHPDLTGRENIYLNATLLGMTRSEVAGKLDEIVDFAGVDEFLDTQVKRYSSGMKVRLGFAVAAHLQSDVLIVDEVLAVGDAEFQRKCLGKMRSVATDGRTVLFVSHNMAAIRNLCSRAMLLSEGTVTSIGPTDDVVCLYLNQTGTCNSHKAWDSETVIEAEGIAPMHPISLTCDSADRENAASFGVDDTISIRYSFALDGPIDRLRVGIAVRNSDDVVLFGSHHMVPQAASCTGNSRWEVACTIPANLLNRGAYEVDVGMSRPPEQLGLFTERGCIQFMVSDDRGHGLAADALPGVVRPKLVWNVTQKS